MIKTIRDRKFYVKELMSEECRCQRSKKRGYSFCFACFRSLPEDMQKDLYNKIGQGYEEAYDTACQYLEE